MGEEAHDRSARLIQAVHRSRKSRARDLVMRETAWHAWVTAVGRAAFRGAGRQCPLLNMKGMWDGSGVVKLRQQLSFGRRTDQLLPLPRNAALPQLAIVCAAVATAAASLGKAPQFALLRRSGRPPPLQVLITSHVDCPEKRKR